MSFALDLSETRRSYFAATGGGASLPAAGALYWGCLAAAGLVLPTPQWILAAFVTSGLIYPLGLLLQKPFGSNINARSPLTSLFMPAFVGMFLSWPVTIAAYPVAPEITPLALAIGMSIHWPVIGWAYGKTLLFTGHAVVRAVAVSAVWFLLPDERFTTLPLMVAVIYLATLAIILVERRRVVLSSALTA